MDLFNYSRRETSEVNIGATPMGGSNPIRIQSMTNTATQDTEASVAQTKRIVDAGGEYVRLTAQGIKEAENLMNINIGLRQDGYMVPLVADIHFNPKVADVAAQYVEKVRINPGNYVDAARTFKHLEYTDEEYAQELQKIHDRFVPFLNICKENHTAIRIRRKNMAIDFGILKNIMALGISPFIMQATESAINIVLNRGLSIYGGDLYVGSMTILQSVMQLAVVPIQGFTQGVQPIISYNFGARKFDRVKKTYRLTISFTFAVATVFCLLTVFFPGVFAGIFTSDQELLALVKKVMPIFMAGIAVFGIQMGCQTTFMGLGQAKISLFIALLRKVILLIPLALILPKFFGVMGIYYAEPISDVTAATTAFIIFLSVRGKIVSEEALSKLG